MRAKLKAKTTIDEKIVEGCKIKRVIKPRTNMTQARYVVLWCFELESSHKNPPNRRHYTEGW